MKQKSYLRSLILTLAVFALIFAAAWQLMNRVDASSQNAQMELVKDAVRHALVTCYATEGYYPGDVAYLKEHYALAYDEEKFIVSIDGFASNVLPDVWVGLKGADGL